MKTRYNLIIIFLISLVILVLIGWFARSFYMFNKELDSYMIVVDEVHEQLGIEIDEYFSRTDGGKKHYGFYRVDPNGILGAAGFENYDDIRYDGNVYELIIFNQEEEIVIPITRDGVDVEISVYIPKLDLNVDPSTLHWGSVW